MTYELEERRFHRSSDPTEALWCYLSSLARRLGCEAIVLSTWDGAVLGGVGDGHDLDWLGALAAVEARGQGEVDLRYSVEGAYFHRFRLGNEPVLLLSVGGGPLPVKECVTTLSRIQALAA